ncbi:VIT1/CCC1 transporter family protein [Cellulomonas sp. DKR-3]|uniref:VIT1/CCC1 transporter family protein n=1 Tax=Cellulomonas fulva TaxID=2835530 RepID=A0ABS5U1Y5_9CELL|nr:VIT1/CCC1 transporter family protein [Cellulomonas fulva]MBT0995400.1 VIT1/CCC1 transporter family protein [Cellulomonas fulva]
MTALTTLLHPATRNPAATPDGQHDGAHGGPVDAARLNRLRAAVLGANDGIVSVAAIVVGVAGADPGPTVVLTAGVAGLVAGALSMAAGEYVSVSSQRDAERAGAVAADQQSNPWHAAFASLGAFVVGGLVPLLVALLPWGRAMVPAVFVAVLLALVVTGAGSARFGRAPVAPAVRRNVVGGSVAMVVTYGIGALVGLAV